MEELKLSAYKTHVFDVDGTLLASNGVKSEAFRRAALPYGREAAELMVALHQGAGSITREARIERFFREVLEREPLIGEVKLLAANVTSHVLDGMRSVGKMAGAEVYLAALPAHSRIVVSGVRFGELMAILDQQRLTRYFRAVYGGPAAKDVLLCEAWDNGDIELPAVYYGDTLDDYEKATAAGLDFVFVYGDTEFAGWAQYFRPLAVPCVRDFEVLRAWLEADRLQGNRYAGLLVDMQPDAGEAAA